jgi:hypothetical protein
MMMTLAMSLFVVCATNQCSSMLFSGIEQVLVFLIFAALILFVINRTSALLTSVIAFALDVVGFVLAASPRKLFLGEFSTPDASVDEPPLLSRFQRPPPLLSV